jgi:hypothetical protein
VNRVGEQNSSKNTNGRAPTARPIAGILAAIAAKSRLNSQKFTYITSKLPGNGDTAPAMAVLGAFGRDPATPGSALFYFGFCGFWFCVNNKTNNIHIQYSRDLTGGEGLKKANFLKAFKTYKTLKKSKSLKSFLDEAFGFIEYAGLNPAYTKSKSKSFDVDFDVDSYAGFSPAYPMEGRDLSRTSV